MKKLLPLTILTLAFCNSFSQDFPSEQYFINIIKLANDSANYIFEGKVIDKQSYWNPEHNFIYTSNTVKVEKVFKGTISDSIVEMITEGGIVGTESLDITPNMGFGVGETGMFFAKIAERSKNPATQPGVLVLQDYDGVFVKYHTNGVDTTATFHFSKFSCLKQFYRFLKTNKLKNCPKKPKKKDQTTKTAKTEKSVKISNIVAINSTIQSDPELRGGVGDQLTMFGQLLGATPGFIRMRNADDGGATWITLDPYDILFWNDTMITIRIPSLVSITDPTIAKIPGTGTIKVITTAPDSAETPYNLIINWAWKNYAIASVPIKKYLVLTGDSPDRGFDFTLNVDMYSDLLTRSNVQQAIDEWICATTVLWKLDTFSTFVNSKIKDGISVITFGTTTESWIVAQTFVWKDRCEGPLGFPDEIGFAYEVDIIMDDTRTWFIQDSITQNLTEYEYDFYATMLHELGHAILLQHVNDPSDIMFWTIPTGLAGGTPYLSRKTGFSVDNLDGGFLIVSVSAAVDIVNCTKFLPMIPFSVSNCSYNPSGINKREKSEEMSLNVYPNPFSFYGLNISYEITRNAYVHFKLFDYTGKEIMTINNGYKPVGKYIEHIDTGELAPGMYFLITNVNGQIQSNKVIKM